MSNPYPINRFLREFVRVWMMIFTWRYRIKANISPEIANLDEPYLLLGNHVGRYDPFIQSHFIKKRPNFVASDAILRDRIIGTAFKKLGAMPKKKGIRDSVIIREMVKVVRAGGALALFPEGARTWSGEPLDIDPSIAKLVRLLRIPVISATMKGSYAYDPRWAKRIRMAGFEIDYQVLLTAEELKELPEDQIFERIRTALAHDNIAYQREKMIEIKSNKRAEFLDLVIFLCPACNRETGFTSTGNEMKCNACNYHLEVDQYGFFTRINGEVYFDNTRDWVKWQNESFVANIKKQLAEGNRDKPLCQSVLMTMQKAEGTEAMKHFGEGHLKLFADRLEIFQNGKSGFTIPTTEIDELSPQFQERLELTVGNAAYRFVSKSEREPGIRWELAINAVWHANGQLTKLSPPFKYMFAD